MSDEEKEICGRLRGLSSEIANSQIADQIVDEVAPKAADVIESLIAALNSMLTFYGMDEEHGEVSGLVHGRVRDAIAKARGEQL